MVLINSLVRLAFASQPPRIYQPTKLGSDFCNTTGNLFNCFPNVGNLETISQPALVVRMFQLTNPVTFWPRYITLWFHNLHDYLLSLLIRFRWRSDVVDGDALLQLCYR